MAATRVILSYPYSAALYAFFAEDMGRDGFGQGPPRPRHPHPYYRTLFGDSYYRYEAIAISLALIFDQIILPPADTYLPADRDEGGNYVNADLGLEVHWEQFSQLQDEAEAFVSLYLQDPVIIRILGRIPDFGRKMILQSCHYEILEAETTNCPIVCGEGRRAILQHLVHKQNISAELQNRANLQVLEDYLELLLPYFKVPGDINTLCEIKQTRPLRQYAKALFRAMGEAGKSDARRVLATEMLEAMNSVDFAERLAGFCETTSTVLSVAGLLPGIGLGASVASLGFSASAKRKAAVAAGAKWWEFAFEVTRQIQLRELRRKLEDERDKAHRLCDDTQNQGT